MTREQQGLRDWGVHRDENFYVDHGPFKRFDIMHGEEQATDYLRLVERDSHNTNRDGYIGTVKSTTGL